MSVKKGFSSALKQAQSGRIGAPALSEPLDVQTSEQPNIQTSERLDVWPSKRLLVDEPREPRRSRRTVYLPPDLARWLKLHAARTEREMSEIVTEALEHYRQRTEG